VKLPASLVRTWGDLQLNFDAIGKTLGRLQFIAFGADVLTWPGGSGFTNTLTVNHGLSRAPTIAVGTATLAAGTPACIVHVVAITSTQIQWRGLDPTSSPAAATTKPFYWLAIG
jgi:hypothetical protein